jgi:hypothetical protein
VCPRIIRCRQRAGRGVERAVRSFQRAAGVNRRAGGGRRRAGRAFQRAAGADLRGSGSFTRGVGAFPRTVRLHVSRVEGFRSEWRVRGYVFYMRPFLVPPRLRLGKARGERHLLPACGATLSAQKEEGRVPEYPPCRCEASLCGHSHARWLCRGTVGCSGKWGTLRCRALTTSRTETLMLPERILRFRSSSWVSAG